MSTNTDATPCNDLYFLGSPIDPLSVQIIGFEDNRPLLYKFETTTSSNNTGTRTEVSTGPGMILASLEWTRGSHLGLCVLSSSKKSIVSALVESGPIPLSRCFTLENQTFDWRRVGTGIYDLYTADSKRIAIYRNKSQRTPIGEAYGYMQYSFKSQDSLLLESLLALCINRWMDLDINQ